MSSAATVPDPVGRRAERKKNAHALVHELLDQGHSRRSIARHLGWGTKTVLRYAAAERWQDTCPGNRPRPSKLDPYNPYLEQRFATSQLPGLTGFALHLLRDLDAVTAGLTFEWSSGSAEGAVNRIKKIKRQLYGRAGFGLLRKMILLQQVPVSGVQISAGRSGTGMDHRSCVQSTR